MTEENLTEETPEVEEPVQSELETLKARADMMGIKYHHKAGVEKLRTLIDNKLNGIEEEPSKPAKKKAAPKKEGKVEYLTEAEFQQLETQHRRRKAGSLVRVRVTCMNPNKKGWEGEIISVGSAKLGTFKKFVPFNAEDGWHIPLIMYEEMKERKFTTFVKTTGPRGQEIKKAKLIPEFSIEVMEPLSKDELKKLAQRQAMANGTSGDD